MPSLIDCTSSGVRFPFQLNLIRFLVASLRGIKSMLELVIEEANTTFDPLFPMAKGWCSSGTITVKRLCFRFGAITLITLAGLKAAAI